MTKITEKMERKPIEIEGAILTTDILTTLKAWQEEDNGVVKSYVNILADCICYLAKTVFNENGEDQELKNLFFDLSTLKDDLKAFSKP